jgi:glycosyltransferase involved in cell wall biosynthesis
MNLNTMQFTEKYFPEIGEVSIIVDNYAYWLNQKHGKSIIVAPVHNDYLDNKPFSVVRSKAKNLKDVLKKQKCDIIHFHSPLGNGEVAVKLASDWKIPVVTTFYPQYYYGIKERLRNRYMKKYIQLFNNVDCLFTTTPMMIDILQYYGYQKEIRLIKGGSDLAYDDKNRTKDKDYIDHLHNINVDANILLYVGTLSWDRNLRLLLEALANLIDFRQNFKMIFIGEGPARNEMVKFVNENQLSKYVVFVGEVTDRLQLMKYYAQANLLVYPLPYDSTALAIREAASFNCPSLALKDVTSIIKDNYNGYLSENNSLSYAQRIISSLNERNKERVGFTANETLAISYEKLVDELSGHYFEIIKASK